MAFAKLYPPTSSDFLSGDICLVPMGIANFVYLWVLDPQYGYFGRYWTLREIGQPDSQFRYGPYEPPSNFFLRSLWNIFEVSLF